jgi:chromosome segregation ATPase
MAFFSKKPSGANLAARLAAAERELAAAERELADAQTAADKAQARLERERERHDAGLHTFAPVSHPAVHDARDALTAANSALDAAKHQHGRAQRAVADARALHNAASNLTTAKAAQDGARAAVEAHVAATERDTATAVRLQAQFEAAENARQAAHDAYSVALADAGEQLLPVPDALRDADTQVAALAGALASVRARLAAAPTKAGQLRDALRAAEHTVSGLELLAFEAATQDARLLIGALLTEHQRLRAAAGHHRTTLEQYPQAFAALDEAAQAAQLKAAKAAFAVA